MYPSSMGELWFVVPQIALALLNTLKHGAAFVFLQQRNPIKRLYYRGS